MKRLILLSVFSLVSFNAFSEEPPQISSLFKEKKIGKNKKTISHSYLTFEKTKNGSKKQAKETYTFALPISNDLPHASELIEQLSFNEKKVVKKAPSKQLTKKEAKRDSQTAYVRTPRKEDPFFEGSEMFFSDKTISMEETSAASLDGEVASSFKKRKMAKKSSSPILKEKAQREEVVTKNSQNIRASAPKATYSEDFEELLSKALKTPQTASEKSSKTPQYHPENREISKNFQKNSKPLPKPRPRPRSRVQAQAYELSIEEQKKEHSFSKIEEIAQPTFEPLYKKTS